MARDRSHLGAASAAFVSLSLVMWLSAPVGGARPVGPESTSGARGGRGETVAALLAWVTEAARTLYPRQGAPPKRPSPPRRLLPGQCRRRSGIRFTPARAAMQAILPAHLNLPPPFAR
jgi:hypothetical protein